MHAEGNRIKNVIFHTPWSFSNPFRWNSINFSRCILYYATRFSHAVFFVCAISFSHVSDTNGAFSNVFSACLFCIPTCLLWNCRHETTNVELMGNMKIDGKNQFVCSVSCVCLRVCVCVVCAITVFWIGCMQHAIIKVNHEFVMTEM